MILLTAEVMELKANPNRMRERHCAWRHSWIRVRGPVASVLVQKGTLHVGDFVSAGSSSGKVRAMVDDKGRRVKEAGPSTAGRDPRSVRRAGTQATYSWHMDSDKEARILRRGISSSRRQGEDTGRDQVQNVPGRSVLTRFRQAI